MTREEKLKLNNERKRAVKEAWSREKKLVCNGKGTVDWTIEQQNELIEKGHVSGYEGQHMKSVNEYPEFAGCVENIQLLSHEDHLAAHNCSEISEKKGYHSPTNGYYDVKTNTIQSFGDGPPRAPEIIDLSNVRLNVQSNEQMKSGHDYIEQQKCERIILKDSRDMESYQMLERW